MRDGTHWRLRWIAASGSGLVTFAMTWALGQLVFKLAHLIRVRMLSVDRASRTFALHPLDADLAYGQMPWHGEIGRQSTERRVADWYANIAPPRATWRSLDAIEPYRREFEHRVRAGDLDDAAMVLGTISEWLVWQGSVLAAISMHLTVDGRLNDERARLAHVRGFGLARLNGGPMAHAVDLFTDAIVLARCLDDRQALQDALFGLGDTHRQMGRLDAAVGPLTEAADLAHEIGDADREVHAILSRSLAYSYRGDGAAALVDANLLDELARASGDLLTEARSWNARSIALLTLGRWEEAIAASDRAMHVYRHAGSKEAITYALNAQGIALIALGRITEALDALEAARHDASQMENPRAEGVCLFNMAWAYWAGGQYGQAEETAKRATVSLQIAGAAEATAAKAFAEAAHARSASDLRAAARALVRVADSIGQNAELLRPSWIIAQAQLLHGEIGETEYGTLSPDPPSNSSGTSENAGP